MDRNPKHEIIAQNSLLCCTVPTCRVITFIPVQPTGVICPGCKTNGIYLREGPVPRPPARSQSFGS